MARPEEIPLASFRARHQADSIGILSGVNRAHCDWACSACGCRQQLVAWKGGQLIARECLDCEATDSRQLSVFGPLVPDQAD